MRLQEEIQKALEGAVKDGLPIIGFRGLYREYTGKYVCVEKAIVDPVTQEKYFVVFDIKYPAREFLFTEKDFFSCNIEIANTGEKLPIRDSQRNVTGQSRRFEKVLDFDNPIKSLSTEDLIRELNSREDNPYASFNLSAVDFVDYVLASKNRDKKGEFMGVLAIFDSYKEALQNSGNKPFSVYKRTWIKAN